MRQRRSRLLGRPLAVLLAAAVTSVAFVGGCSDDDSDTPPGDPSAEASQAADVPPLVTATTVGRVTGKLGDKQKKLVKEQVGEIVDAFFDGAYLGEFPRSSVEGAYAAFTKGAAEDAVRDADLMSNATIADRLEEAVAVDRQVALDVLAVKGRPEGVTARFSLAFDTTGELERRERVKGYLLLDREGDGWQVFGYNVIRKVVA